ncbi:calcium/sodium antiporter [Halosquirtibacter xylanolyticus]|uniref:calcium/sodium antiporter n=1 Tax=Halosquirtibacter xylanolyticus TaxID=3374599 RepID=UPI0037486E13|nr:calcium/sodium antiporter [Prolixibacteraceae bacterium]
MIDNPYLQLIIGMVILILSGDYLVKGGVELARKFRISTLVVGSTVVAMGTSAPELIVSLKSAMMGHTEMAIGNVVGSNISNIALVLGATAIIIAIPVKLDTLKVGWPTLLAATVVFLLLGRDMEISTLDGAILTAGMFGFIILSIVSSRKSKEATEFIEAKYPVWKSILIIVLSCLGLAYGSNHLIEGASTIAKGMGISERVISVTIIAIGTSLPELTASIMAALKGETDISVGNIIGSNIFNLLGVVGITSMIKPIHVALNKFHYDFMWMLGITILLVVFIYPVSQNRRYLKEGKYMMAATNLKGGILRRWEGIILITAYATYVFSIL